MQLNTSPFSTFPVSPNRFSNRMTPLRPYRLHEYAQSKNMPGSRVEATQKQRRGCRSTSGSEVYLFGSSPLQPETIPETTPTKKISMASRARSFTQLQPQRIARQHDEVLDLGSDGEADVEKDRYLMPPGENLNYQDMVGLRTLNAEKAATSKPSERLNHEERSSVRWNVLESRGPQLGNSLARVDSKMDRTAIAANKLPLDRIITKIPSLQQNSAEIQTTDVILPRNSSVARQQTVGPIDVSSISHLDKRGTSEGMISKKSGTVKRKCADDEDDEHKTQSNCIPKSDLKALNKESVFSMKASANKTDLVVPSHTNVNSLKNAITLISSPRKVTHISQEKSGNLSTEPDPIIYPEQIAEQKPSIHGRQETALKEHVQPLIETGLSSSSAVSGHCGEHSTVASLSRAQDLINEQTPFIPNDGSQSLFVQDSSDDNDLDNPHARNNDINALQPILSSGKKREVQGTTKCAERGKQMSNSVYKNSKIERDNDKISQQQLRKEPPSPNGKDKNSHDIKVSIKRDSDKIQQKRSKSKPHHVEPGDIKKMRQFGKILKARRRIPVVFMNDDDCTTSEVSLRSDEIEQLNPGKVDEKGADERNDPAISSTKKNYVAKHIDENSEVQRRPDESPLGDAQSKYDVITTTSRRVDETVIATKNIKCNESVSRVPESSTSHETAEVGLYAFGCSIIKLICIHLKGKAPAPLLKPANQDSARTEPLEHTLERPSKIKCTADEFGANNEDTCGPPSASSPSATTVGEHLCTHTKQPAHDIPSGHNSAHDRLILELRGEDRKWKEVQQVFEQQTGRHLSFKVLRNRFKIAADYLKNSIEGQKECAYSENTGPLLRQTSDTKPVADVDLPEIDGEKSRNRINVQAATDHGVTGTKSWNNDAFQAYLKTMANEAANDKEEDEAETLEVLVSTPSSPQQEPTRPESPVTSEDVCYWEYQIKRKNWLTGDANVDLDYEDEDEAESLAEWTVVGSKTYSSLQQANYAAGEEVLRERDGCALGPDVRQWTYQLNENDMAEYYGSSHDNKRHFKVTVDRFLRNPTSGLLPASKMGWLSKRVYEIKQRVVALKADSEGANVCDESNEKSEASLPVSGANDEKVLDGLYTILDQANREAGRMVLNITTKPDSIRIDDQIHRVEAQKEMREILDQLEVSNNAFSETAMLPDNRKVTIWVEQRELKGPRNI